MRGKRREAGGGGLLKAGAASRGTEMERIWGISRLPRDGLGHSLDFLIAG